MNQDDILRMAREASILGDFDSLVGEQWRQDTIRDFERFATLVAAAERRRCAQIAREFDRDHPNTNYGGCIARLIEETNP